MELNLIVMIYLLKALITEESRIYSVPDKNPPQQFKSPHKFTEKSDQEPFIKNAETTTQNYQEKKKSFTTKQTEGLVHVTTDDSTELFTTEEPYETTSSTSPDFPYSSKPIFGDNILSPSKWTKYSDDKLLTETMSNNLEMESTINPENLDELSNNLTDNGLMTTEETIITKTKPTDKNMMKYLTPKPFIAPPLPVQNEEEINRDDGEKDDKLNTNNRPQSPEGDRLYERKVKRSKIPWKKRLPSVNPVDYDFVCTLPYDEGRGPSKLSAWYYDSSSGYCQWFQYYGNGENGNRFTSRANCESICIEDRKDICHRKDVISCEKLWLKCTLMHDTECLKEAEDKNIENTIYCPPMQPVCTLSTGKRNSFQSSSEIILRKPPIYVTHRKMVPAECKEPRDPGDCIKDSYSSVVFYYEENINDCLSFLYSNCGGNSNRFPRKVECMNHCAY